MKKMSISEARSHLPAVIEEVAQSHEALVVTRYGTPMAAIVPYQGSDLEEDRYPLRAHSVTVTEDFDHPMPHLWEALAIAEKHAAYTTDGPETDG